MIDELARELAAVGIRGRLRRRILTETADHIRSDPEGAGRFGDPRTVANSFAAELGTQASRRAALRAFVVLGLAGVVYAATFVAVALRPNRPEDSALASIALVVVILAPQISFVSGSLALVRTLRLSGSSVLPTAELDTINRRTRVALVSGLATMAGLAAYALAARDELPSWIVVLAIAGSAVTALPIVVATLLVARAARLRPRVAGIAGDVFSDLGVTAIEPWQFARRVALLVAFVVWLQAALQGDPIDGVLLALCEALACLSGFAVFGRYLGLRR